MENHPEINSNLKLRSETKIHWKIWVMGIIPVVILGMILLIITNTGLFFFGKGGPPVEELSFNRISLEQNKIIAKVQNTGHEALTIAQVAVNEFYVDFSLEPGNVIPRLGSATLIIPYHWVEEEPLHIMAVSSIGSTFEGEVPVAVLSPEPDASTLGMFALIGLFVGVIPVMLGLLWKPFLAKIGNRAYRFFLSLTVGLLVFLAVDTMEESLEIAAGLAGVLQGIGLIATGIITTILILTYLQRKVTMKVGQGTGASAKLVLAYMIAVGIGLHNLGEGLAIGSAYALGEIAFGAFLIIGFMVHNLTEGLAIVAPISRKEHTPHKLIGHLIALGLVAGAPAILGTWLGGMVYSPVWSLVFLSIGAGAIIQVIFEVGKLMKTKDGSWIGTPEAGLGIVCGLAVMYVTGLFVIG